MISDRAMVHAINNSTAGRRVSAVAAPGSLLKRQTPVQPRESVREAAGRDVSYLAMVRQLPCLKCGMEPSESAHVRFASAAYGKASGLQKKPEDRWALSLCASCHRLARDAQHNRREQDFWNDLGISPLDTCVKLYAQRGDLGAMRAIVMVTIAERGASAARSMAGDAS